MTMHYMLYNNYDVSFPVVCYMQILITVLTTLANITVQTSLEDMSVPALQAIV